MAKTSFVPAGGLPQQASSADAYQSFTRATRPKMLSFNAALHARKHRWECRLAQRQLGLLDLRSFREPSPSTPFFIEVNQLAFEAHSASIEIS